MRLRALLPGRRRRGAGRRRWLRLGLQPLVLAAAVVAAGCGSDEKKTAKSTSTPTVSQARSPSELALARIKADETQAARVTTLAEASPEGTGPTTVTILQEGIADDSVAAVRHILRYEPDGDGWRLVSEERAQRCRAGRGHQNFGSARCL